MGVILFVQGHTSGQKDKRYNRLLDGRIITTLLNISYIRFNK